MKYSPFKRFKMGKYANENGSAKAVRKFQMNFQHENSTVREFLIEL